MRVTTFIAVGLAALVTAAGAGAAPRHARGIEYLFVAQLTAAPANGRLSVTVERGNRHALRAMLGQSVSQTFSYDGGTEFLKWSHGVPSVVQAGDLSAGDYVWIHIRDTPGAPLAEIEQQAASLVGDHGSHLGPPNRPLYLFRGTLTTTGPGSVTLDVQRGNRRAMRLLIGQSKNATFTTSDNTIFLLWQGKVPTVITPGQLTSGDNITIRIRAPRHSTLNQIETTPAVHVADHEPASA